MVKSDTYVGILVDLSSGFQIGALGVFIFRVTFGTEMQGRQKVAKFCKIFKNNFLTILKFFFQGAPID